MKPPDDRFKLVDYTKQESGGLNCLALMLVAAVLAMLLTLALYGWDVIQ